MSTSTEPFLFDPQNRAVAAGERPYKDPDHFMTVFNMISTMLMVFAGSVFLFWYGYDFYTNQRETRLLAQAGQVGDGVVVDQVIRRFEDHTDYLVDYRFIHPLPNGEPRSYGRMAEVTRETFEQLEYGQRVEVRFVPGEPTISRMIGELPTVQDTTSFVILLVVGGSILLILGRIVWAEGRKLRHFRNLTRNGRLIQGVVLGAETEAGDDDTLMVTLRYRFTPPDGGVIDNEQRIPIFYNQRRGVSAEDFPAGRPILLWYMNHDTYKVL